uniref:Probable acetate kinase n=1 Tax=Aureoumbra lagunensis TaxID=44058 RepID=A0A7S3JS71_9STRA|mmetsp:Transcript_2290/g.3641  ORF Transcript_2290/g.3641 Transcript_2290/m.3641 type:complete len:413 (+) Transcript_2290:71-1309(+)
MAIPSASEKYALVLNSGSSSIKYGVFELKKENEVNAKSVLSGQVEKIGKSVEGGQLFTVKNEETGKKDIKKVEASDHAAALECIATVLKEKGFESGMDVVGHRVVHGGADFSEPALVNEKTLACIEKNVPLAPLHNPPALLGLRSAMTKFSSCPHVAVFDTAFHASMPPESFTYAIPYQLYEKYSIRRYGFHGTSYAYVSQQVIKSYPNIRSMIICHLGNGASMCCIKDGKCLDTTMGLTPLDGLMMGTRSGDIDAGLHIFLHRELGKSPAEIDTILNKQSGLIGLSGISSDMREVLAAAESGNARAILARKVYIERIRKYLGAYLIKLRGKCGAIVFTAGVGENDSDLRAQVCSGLETFGISLDSSRNYAKSDSILHDIGSATSVLKILVAATNEEQAIALHSASLANLFL